MIAWPNYSANSSLPVFGAYAGLEDEEEEEPGIFEAVAGNWLLFIWEEEAEECIIGHSTTSRICCRCIAHPHCDRKGRCYLPLNLGLPENVLNKGYLQNLIAGGVKYVGLLCTLLTA